MRLSALVGCVCVVLGCAVVDAEAATLKVCASGCQYTDIQAALNAAQFGDTILLHAGETYVGHYTLPVKSGSGVITIRSDAADAQLPKAGTRLIPSDRTGANTSRSLLPRLIGKGGVLKTTPILRTAAGAHGYKVQYVEFDGVAHLGYETLIALGDDTTAATAYDLVLDHVYVHGDKYKGQKRGISLNSGRTTISDSYITDIKAVNADSQAIAAYNGTGPYTITNNHLEAAGENVLFGGSGPAVTNLVPSDADIRRNLFTKPLTWRNDILKAPTGVKATASTGGSLSAGTQYFRVVALMATGTRIAASVPSAAVSAKTSTGGKVTVSWSAVAGADSYQIYRGSSATSQSVSMKTSGAVTSFAYTGSGEAGGAPATAATKWTVKNILELKNAERITLDGNIFENSWDAGQFGYAIVLTPRNSSGHTPWVRVKDIVFTNNIVRNASGVINIAAYDDTATSGRTENVTLRNNLFEGIDPSVWGGGAKVFLIQNGPKNIVIDGNTIVHTNSSVVYASGSAQASGFVYTNNNSRHNTYGIMGGGTSSGTSTISHYFPSANVTCNVLAGGTASRYPAPNSFPSEAQWTASFADFAEGDYRVLSGSVVAAGGCAGRVPGLNFTTFTAAQGGTSTPPPPPPESDNEPPVAHTGGPYSGSLTADVQVNASTSTDPDGTISGYQWSWGDQMVIRAADLAASAIHGSDWMRAAVSGAAGGFALQNPDKGAAKRSTAQASPASYVEFTIRAAAGVPYQMWIRTRAINDSFSNDSLFVQFSGAVDASGHAIARIGSTNALAYVLQEGDGAAMSGWGWNDAGYGTLGGPIYFASSGVQTVRIQQREDGISWDQFVVTSSASATTRPGAVRSDATILSSAFQGAYGTSSGVTAGHRYAHAGAYPLVLAVADNASAVALDSTTVTIGGGSSSSLVADSGGPYSGTVNAGVAVDGRGSTVPSGSPTYGWQFGDDIVLHAASFKVTGSAWQRVSDTSAADGVAIDNPDHGAAKIGTAKASPSSYVEATFRAAPGVPYRVWLRLKAAGNSWSNDSVYVQFSGSATASGTAAWRMGTTQALAVVLEDGNGAGVSGWGWADSGYGTVGDPVYFNQDSVQTIRIHQREDGMRIDQIVISSNAWGSSAPGPVVGDATIVPVNGADGRTVTAQHVYHRAGTYPITLTVKSGSSVAEDTTTVVVR